MELLTRIKELEDAFNKTTDSALQLMEINKEHQRINGELREENERLNNNIKEVKEYIEDVLEYEGKEYTHVIKERIIEILEKENEKE